MLALEFLDKVVDETVVEIFTTKMGVTGSGLDFKDTLFNGQEGDIKSTTTKIEDENVLLSLSLLVETIGDGGGGGFIDDTEDVQAGNQTGVLGSLALRVVEVGGDGDDGIVDGRAKVGFGGFLHLEEDHGRDFFRGESLLLALVLDLDLRLAAFIHNLERPVLHISLDFSIVETGGQ